MEALTLEQRVGQLFIVGTSADSFDPAAFDAVSRLQVGGVFLHGRSHDGVEATAAVVAEAASAASTPVPLTVATDQEGGSVQVLNGPGFSDIPSAVIQGGMDRAELLQSATQWGSELASAGVTLNLAPVLDVPLDPEAAQGNAPIGAYGRHFGYEPVAVADAGLTFAEGMAASDVASVYKHFPGLGLVTLNTDSTVDVVDEFTTPSSPSVAAFARVIDAGADWIMVSSARYLHLDSERIATFSPAILEGLLREDLGFDGVILTDDVSAADAFDPWTPAERAVRAIEAGCDVVLVSADPNVAAQMVEAVLARARDDPMFLERVNEAASRVLFVKGWQTDR